MGRDHLGLSGSRIISDISPSRRGPSGDIWIFCDHLGSSGIIYLSLGSSEIISSGIIWDHLGHIEEAKFKAYAEKLKEANGNCANWPGFTIPKAQADSMGYREGAGCVKLFPQPTKCACWNRWSSFLIWLNF